jgi:tRNA pseudouridine55 synthase
MTFPEVSGLLVLDKPVGITSRQAVDRVQRWFPKKTRLGHTGTLDPLASGVLVLCVGRATRLTEYVQDMTKNYIADVILGSRSATDDAEGPITPVKVEGVLERADVDAAVAPFLGFIQQVPPAFSAAKVAGRRSYDLARRGTPTVPAVRKVRIDRIDVGDFDYPRLRIEVRCGKGTYIRSLARDLGERLGCGAYVGGLRRTAVGPFTTADAVPLDTDVETARARLLPPAAAVAGLPAVVTSDAEIDRLKHGQTIGPRAAVPADADVAVFGGDGSLAAIATADSSGRTLRPAKVFHL